MSCKASYRWTEELFAKSLYYHTRKTSSLFMRYFCGVFLSFFSLIPLSCGVLSIGDEWFPYSLMYFGLFLSVLFHVINLFFHEKVQVYFGVNKFRKQADRNALFVWEFDEMGLNLSVDIGVRLSFPWRMIFQVREMPDGFLIYNSKDNFYWIPFSAFEQEGGPEQFRAFAAGSNVRWLT